MKVRVTVEVDVDATPDEVHPDKIARSVNTGLTIVTEHWVVDRTDRKVVKSWQILKVEADAEGT